MKLTRSVFTGLAALLVLASGLMAQNKASDVLSLVDEKSDIVIVVPSIAEANKAAAQFIKDLQLPLPIPPMEKPLNMLFMQVGIMDGIDENGSAAMVVSDLKAAMDGDDPVFYFLLPIADEAKITAAFKEKAEAVEGEEGMFETRVQGAGRVYYKVMGKYLVLGPNARGPASAKQAKDPAALLKKAGTLGRANMAEGQIFAYVNVANFGPALSELVKEGFAEFEEELDHNAGDAELEIIGGVESVKAIVQMVESAVHTTLTETDAAVASLDLSKAGVKLNVAAQFKPDTQLGKMFAQSPSGELSLDRLPNENFMIAGAFNMQQIPVEPLIKAIEEDIVPKIPADSPVGDLVRGYVASIDATQHVKNSEFAWYLPTNDTESPVRMGYVYELDDPGAYMTKQRKALKQITRGLERVLELAKAQDDDAPGLSVVYKEEAEQIDGVTVDILKVKIVPPDDAAAEMAMMPASILAMMDQTTYLGVKGNTMIGAQGGGKALFSKIVKASDGSGKLTSHAAIAAARKRLPGDRFAEAYFNVGGYLQMVMTMMSKVMAQQGMQGLALPAVPDMPPIAFSGSQKDSALGLSVDVPLQTIKQSVTFGFNMRAMAMGGMQPNAPAPPVQPMPVDTHEVEGDELQPDAAGDHTDAAPAPAVGEGAVTALDDDAFADAIGRNDQPTVVLYWASWSTNAKKQAKTHLAVSAQFNGKARFASVDVDKADVTVESQAIQTVPVTKVYLGGKEVATKVGVTTQAQLKELVNKHLK